MKTHPNSTLAARPAGLGPTWYALLALLSVTSAAGAAEAPRAPKDHALFVGSTLWVGDGTASREVVGAETGAALVVVDGKPRAIPLRDLGTVRIEQSLKLTNFMARIDRLECTPVARPGEDAAVRQYIVMNALRDEAQEAADMSFRTAAMYAGLAAAPPMTEGDTSVQVSASQIAAEELKAMEQSQIVANSADRMAAGLVPQGGAAADQLEISAEIAAPQATKSAFLLVDTEYRESSTGPALHRLHLEPVRGLGLTPKRVRFTQAGFPAGFIFGGTELHLYIEGREVATNLSAKRVDLTADEALQYLTICYLTSHPKETLPAVPQRLAVPAGFKERTPATLLERPVYATVAADGSVRRVCADEAGTVAADHAVDSVVKRFRFFPALKEGKAVESVVTLKLGDFLK